MSIPGPLPAAAEKQQDGANAMRPMAHRCVRSEQMALSPHRHCNVCMCVCTRCRFVCVCVCECLCVDEGPIWGICTKGGSYCIAINTCRSTRIYKQRFTQPPHILPFLDSEHQASGISNWYAAAYSKSRTDFAATPRVPQEINYSSTKQIWGGTYKHGFAYKRGIFAKVLRLLVRMIYACADTFVGLATTIYIRCTYGISGQGSHRIHVYVWCIFIWFWPTLCYC